MAFKKKRIDISEEILADVLDCGTRDVDLIISLYKLALDLGAIKGFDEIMDEAEISGFNKIDCNTIIYLLINRIVYDLAPDVGKDFEEWVNEEWSPYINYLDSHFNIEPLDDLKWYSGRGRKINRKRLVQKIRSWFKKEIKR